MSEQRNEHKPYVTVVLALALIALFFCFNGPHDMFGIVTDWVLNTL